MEGLYTALFVIGFIILVSSAWWLPALVNGISDSKAEKEFAAWKDNIVKNGKPMSIDSFMHQPRLHDFEGVYIIHNTSKDMYYVGQGINVMTRARQHFQGRGNGDVYADYKYGDTFEIILLALDETEFDNLNDLERTSIAAFHAYDRGYNRNRGNR